MLIVLNGDVDQALLQAERRAAAYVVGADGGAAALTRGGAACDLIIGDRDSMDDRTLAAARALNPAVEVRGHPRPQYATDAEVALEAAMEKSPDTIVVLGGFGGARLDHELANVMLLAHPGWRGADVVLRDPSRDVRLISGRRRWRGAPGDIVTLLALGGDALGVATEGLQYALEDAVLPFGSGRGVSNVMSCDTAAVEVKRGTILLIHERRGDPA